MTTDRKKDDGSPPQEYDGGGHIIARFPIKDGPDADEIWRLHMARNSLEISPTKRMQLCKRRRYFVKRRGPAKLYLPLFHTED